MKKLTVSNGYKKVYLKPTHGHEHKRNPDVRRTLQLVSLVSHFIARTSGHSTCIYMASCLGAAQMTVSHILVL